MFEKVLIANRGEIACRVMRTCQRLGIKTVAVYSEADADAMHVRMADEAVLIGPPPARESYLDIEKVVRAVTETGAEAVHPGYGFLSENAAFAEALDAAGVVFIGPPRDAIQAMGDKIESKRLAVEAGVSVVPGTPDPVASPSEALKAAEEIGFPVMIKAAAGGGGKGMRVALDRSDLQTSLERAMSEARSSFGDDRVFLERFIERPRHIEIQVLADRYGNTVYLGERECSIQRRHQKVIEEAPSPFLDTETREAMGNQATALAARVAYHSAGTVEFIVDQQRNFYFLEMNTRLQVEHPVTELVTGLDLVELMIRIAAGQRLPFAQDEVRLDGWALEARVYAEDPARGFLPSTGRLVRYIEPEGDGLRCDSGVVEGSEVSMFYDPMIAKLCSYGETREEAVDRLSLALDGMYVRGLNHNIAFLTALLSHKRFRSGDLSTDFIAAEFGERFEAVELTPSVRAGLAAIAVCLRVIEARRASRVTGQIRGYVPKTESQWSVGLAGDVVSVTIEPNGSAFGIGVGDLQLQVEVDWSPGQPLVSATIDGREIVVQVDPISEGYRLSHGGIETEALVRTREAAEFAARMPPKVPPDTSKLLMSPMPGLIIGIQVRPGDQVKAGQEVVILEAMKMENVLRAERDAVVEEVRVEKGAVVASDEILVRFA